MQMFQDKALAAAKSKTLPEGVLLSDLRLQLTHTKNLLRDLQIDFNNSQNPELANMYDEQEERIKRQATVLSRQRNEIEELKNKTQSDQFLLDKITCLEALLSRVSDIAGEYDERY
jgi:hypothetical protein